MDTPVVPPLRPAVPQQSTETLPDGSWESPQPVRYSLAEAFEKGILPWQAVTARTYMRRRLPVRGVPVP
ncbi:hypothetical protein ABZ864_44200 [Streptomyces sp. NPDC047082]|uniref:hypothetical protein n=1 Tax=Streptomyces sp. NPDC047082 TaxID=3155259 RepID=UPI00340F8375